MATYSELMEQAQQLMQQAEEARKAEISSVVADIKEKISKYGLTAKDLGLIASAGSKKAGTSGPKQSAPAKYRGPNGELWSGGAGRKPKWVIEAQAAGKNIEDFRI